MVDPALGIKLVYIFGWINIISIGFVLFSCRCTPIRLPKRIKESGLYKEIYKYHCYYWWFFILSVLVHATIATTVFGNPFLR